MLDEIVPRIFIVVVMIALAKAFFGKGGSGKGHKSRDDSIQDLRWRK